MNTNRTRWRIATDYAGKCNIDANLPGAGFIMHKGKLAQLWACAWYLGLQAFHHGTMKSIV
jgi:hypothetical protein